MIDIYRSKKGSKAKTNVTTFSSREIKTRVYGKRQTSESHFNFLKITNKHTRAVQNNSCVNGKHESAYFHLVTANGKRQMRRNHGHVVTFAVCRLP